MATFRLTQQAVELYGIVAASNSPEDIVSAVEEVLGDIYELEDGFHTGSELTVEQRIQVQIQDGFVEQL